MLDGDIEAIVALLGQDLTSPHQYTRVAEAMLELERDDDALQWAERGIEATSGWQVKHLYDIAAGVHEANGNLTAVLGVRLDHHQDMPSTSTYGLLRDAASAVGSWDSHVAAAREVLGRRDRGSVVDVLLADGETEAAWSLAAGDGGDLGPLPAAGVLFEPRCSARFDLAGDDIVKALPAGSRVLVGIDQQPHPAGIGRRRDPFAGLGVG